MKFIGGFKGATAYEFWVWRVYARIPYLEFLRVGCRPSVGIDWEIND
jgi:hypothetical protein